MAEPSTTSGDLAFGRVSSSRERWLKGKASCTTLPKFPLTERPEMEGSNLLKAVCMSSDCGGACL